MRTPTPNDNLETWLHFIAHQHHKPIDLGLSRLHSVAKKLGVLQPNAPIVTVAGTNGKGSCVATIEAVLSAAGYRAGAYFSPHLIRYHERVRLAGQEVDDQALCEAFNAIENVRGALSLTYFEWGTLAAFWLFQRAKLDAWVLEVGLGGRLDAVNLIDPDVAVITTVDLDHQEWLGQDRDAIGKEKAGIFRFGKPAICGDFHPPHSVTNAAEALHAPFYGQGVDFGYTPMGDTWKFWYADIKKRLPMPSLLLQNVTAALMALLCLPGIKVTDEAIALGLTQLRLPGRFQIVSDQPQVILDVAHNPQSCRALANRLEKLPTTGKTYAICGMLSDKDHVESLRPLLPYINDWYLADLGCERSIASTHLTQILQNHGVQSMIAFPSIQAAYQTAFAHATIYDRIIVFGSFYAVAPILNYLKSSC